MFDRGHFAPGGADGFGGATESASDHLETQEEAFLDEAREVFGEVQNVDVKFLTFFFLLLLYIFCFWEKVL